VQTLHFVKYHGLGNDFIVVDTATPARWTKEQARALCDRHRGVGGDGVLLVGPSTEQARASMRVLNADGSEPEMCGNGLRCVALHLALADDAVETSFAVQTGAGLLGCAVSRQGPSASVKLDMGKAELLGELRFAFEDRLLTFQRVSTGNPHAILFDEPFDEAGRRQPQALAGRERLAGEDSRPQLRYPMPLALVIGHRREHVRLHGDIPFWPLRPDRN